MRVARRSVLVECSTSTGGIASPYSEVLLGRNKHYPCYAPNMMSIYSPGCLSLGCSLYLSRSDFGHLRRAVTLFHRKGCRNWLPRIPIIIMRLLTLFVDFFRPRHDAKRPVTRKHRVGERGAYCAFLEKWFLENPKCSRSASKHYKPHQYRSRSYFLP